MLRKESRYRILFGRKGGAIYYAKHPTFSVNQRILNCRHLLIQAHFILFGILTSHKTSLVSRLFDLAIGQETSYATAFHSVSPDLVQHRTRAVNEDRRFHNLFCSKRFLLTGDWRRACYVQRGTDQRGTENCKG